jgi:type II secretory pathway component PulF
MRAPSPYLYDQLAWLAKSQLPLPQGLAELAASVRQPGLARLMQQLSQATGAGITLAEAMRQMPETFPPLHVELVATGERTGTLADMLHEIAELAREEVSAVQRLREGLTYPALAILTALWLSLGILAKVVPKFARMFDEMLAGEPLPLLTNVIIEASSVVVHHLPFTLACLAVLTLAIFWSLFGGARALHHWLLLLHLLPGGYRLHRLLDCARLCAVLGLYTRNGTPLTDALDMAQPITDTPALRQCLVDWREALAAGGAPATIIGTDLRIDPMLALTFRHAPEADLPDALTRLAAVLRERVNILRQRLVALWVGTVIFLTCLFVGLTVLAMFQPLIKLIDSLGGGG